LDLYISWLYPDGFDPNTAAENPILATTNKSVENWNETIQSMNIEELHTLYSDDKFSEVDDPYGHLQRNLKDRVLNSFNGNGVPRHNLL
jgi:hypothetical protein